MLKPPAARRALAAGLCFALLLPLYPAPARADEGPRITVEIGQPSVWSLGQAHYLLAKMHRTNRKLDTRFPTAEDLDSNKIAATRIEALRSTLGVEGQFDQSMGVRNNLALRRFREGEIRRETSRADLRTRQGELQQVNGELLALNEQIAVLEEEDRQSTEARGRSTPPAPPTAEDNERKKQIVLLKVRRTQKEGLRDDLKGQVTSLTTAAETPTATPEFQNPSFTSTPTTLPNPDAFKDFMKKAVEEAGKPDLAASMKLDNFVQMQYEIISKQLTLLRDEVGPEDRVIFLELPASIYTVDKKADGYVAQVEWEVEEYCDKEPPAEIQADVIRDILIREGREDEADDILLRIDKVRDVVIRRRAWDRLSEDNRTQAALNDLDASLAREGLGREERRRRVEQERMRRLPGFLDAERERIEASHGRSTAPYPVTLEMIKRYRGMEGGQCAPGNTEQVRAIDIIPRQSALNVNEYHATVKETMILAAFKFLVGFAGRVNYQRQRELYEQFVQQQVFASGYGKGTDKFGWTHGPQPGTNRIQTGQRTTFAVLVVPRNTLALRLKARSRFYKRGKSPRDPDRQTLDTPPPGRFADVDDKDVTESADADFLLSVPGKRTQEFWVDQVSYTPVKKGRRVTAIVEGNYFSPQLGIMVNGVPLEPVLSISRIAGTAEEPDVQSADGVAGEYEVTNSRQIVLSFKMPDDYVGTPTITFTSPEKSLPINFFDLVINHRRGDRTSLQDASLREPMFMDDFSDKQEIEVIRSVGVVNAAGQMLDANGAVTADEASQRKFKLVRLKGGGMRPGADIILNNAPVRYMSGFDSFAGILRYVTRRPTPTEPFATQDSTRSYILYVEDTGAEKWKIAYRHLTRQGYEDASAAKDFSTPFATKVRNYRFLPATRRAEVDLTFTSTNPVAQVEMDDPPPTRASRCEGVRPGGDNEYRVKCFVPADARGRLERDFITVRLVFANGRERYEDIRLPVRPLLLGLVNPRTGRAEGFVDEEPTVVLSGINLQGVTAVFFGDKEAKVVGAASPEAIAVKVPKGAAVPKGQAAAVPVILQTSAGQAPSGAVYTYVGEPLPPNVVVWPYPPRP